MNHRGARRSKSPKEGEIYHANHDDPEYGRM